MYTHVDHVLIVPVAYTRRNLTRTTLRPQAFIHSPCHRLSHVRYTNKHCPTSPSADKRRNTWSRCEVRRAATSVEDEILQQTSLILTMEANEDGNSCSETILGPFILFSLYFKTRIAYRRYIQYLTLAMPITSCQSYLFLSSSKCCSMPTGTAIPMLLFNFLVAPWRP